MVYNFNIIVINILLVTAQQMQHKADYLLFCKFTLHVSGVNHTNHQDYTKL